MTNTITPIKEGQAKNLTYQVFEDRTAMGKAAGRDVIESINKVIKEKGHVRMIFAAAPSQSEVLEQLVATKDVDWSKVTVFHMDEYIGYDHNSNNSFAYFLNKHLFKQVKPKTVNLINGNVSDYEQECQRYVDLLTKEPIDIVCLGIGENGHIAFNEPEVADFQDPKKMKVVPLDDICRQQQVNEGLFPTIDDVPKDALTVTIPMLLSASHLFCVVPGPTKHNAVIKTLQDPITTDTPSTILRKHADCTLYLDQEAFGRGAM
ncbi:glucosamine-6-phosphate deaminase [Radiobacillus sp. PE A8.2]|uniref:glucosamine-6-phosphate deaminase n=1 Tax=Radiobacillus sp. PE A8.2 TaxID=3380349 RepID=UPI00389084E4